MATFIQVEPEFPGVPNCGFKMKIAVIQVEIPCLFEGGGAHYSTASLPIKPQLPYKMSRNVRANYNICGYRFEPEAAKYAHENLGFACNRCQTVSRFGYFHSGHGNTCSSCYINLMINEGWAFKCQGPACIGTSDDLFTWDHSFDGVTPLCRSCHDREELKRECEETRAYYKQTMKEWGIYKTTGAIPLSWKPDILELQPEVGHSTPEVSWEEDPGMYFETAGISEEEFMEEHLVYSAFTAEQTKTIEMSEMDSFLLE